MGTGLQWQAGSNQSLGTWANALTSGYNAQLAQFNANQNASSGWGSALGLLGGIGMAALKFEDGGAVDPSATPGGNVPASASPTAGGAVDDVQAALTVGEFVIPKDVAEWNGEAFFQKLIDKSRKEKADATAKPSYGPATGAAPTFVSTNKPAVPA